MSPTISLIVFMSIGVGAAWLTGRRDARWRVEAHKMAEAADLALPAQIEPLVMRYLRNRWAAGLPLGVAVIAAVAFSVPSGLKPALRPGGVVLGLAVIPAVFVVAGVLPSLIVRWRAQGSPRLAHLERLSVRDVTTMPERWALVAAVGASCATAVIGFDSLTSRSPWVWLAPVVLLLASGCAWWFARTTLSGRSAGSDALELAWDDVLRIRKVREALTAVVFMLPVELFAVGALRLFRPLPPGATGSNMGLSQPLLLVAVALGVGIYTWALRENRVAYRSWRRLWPQVPPATSAGAAG